MLSVPRYLDRIGYQGSLDPSIETLRGLHLAHLLAIPFENLDIHIGREIVCDESRFLYKIIDERRGGFCYELNGAFAALLRELGFRVALLAAGVARPDGSDGPEFDHLTLRVDLEEPWLADVGFGDSFLEPLRLQADLEQSQFGQAYRLHRIDEVFNLEVWNRDRWKRQYAFRLQPRQLSDFAAMCRYQQTSPESHFTQNRICSRATPEGRITLTNGKLIETRTGVRTEKTLSEEEWAFYLRDGFGVILPKVE